MNFLTVLKPSTASIPFYLFNGRLFFLHKILPFIIVFMGFIAMSPIFIHFGWRGVFSLLVVTLVSSAFLILTNLKLKKWFLYLTLIILISSSVAALYWVDIRYIFANVFFLGVLYLLQFTTIQIINKAITISTSIILIILIGAVIGFILALSGQTPLFDFPNPDARPNFFFYTTLSNSYIGNLIRPSGIYDEPGALSLYVCAIAVMRHLLDRNNKITWVILLLGFVTLSLAHLIYVFFHFLSEHLSKKNIQTFLSIITLSIGVIFVSGFNIILEEKLFQRLVISDSSGSLQGDNRSYMMHNAIDLMSENPKIIVFGADPTCRFDYEYCKTLFKPIGSNPLTPLFTNGILVSWPFYLALIVLLLSPILGRKYFVAFGFGLLLLQRPLMLSLPGAMISSLILLILIDSIRQRLNSKGVA